MNNEPGREPTEPTDAELLRAWMKAQADIEDSATRMVLGVKSADSVSKHMALIESGAPYYNAVRARGREYLSGQRPMPPGNCSETPKSSKPPLGVIPEWLWKEQRRADLSGAIQRYSEKHLMFSIPAEWFDELDRLIAAGVSLPDTPAPDEVAQLRAEVTEQSATIARQFELLKDIANVLNGQAGETELWSHADLPEMATRLTARVAELEAELAGRAATVGINDDLLERNGELLAALENIRAKHHGDEAYNIACDALGVAR